MTNCSCGFWRYCAREGCKKIFKRTLKHNMNLDDVYELFENDKLLLYDGFRLLIHRLCLLKINVKECNKLWCDRCIFPKGKETRKERLNDGDLTYLDARILDKSDYLVRAEGWLEWPDGEWVCGDHVREFNVYVCENKDCRHAISEWGGKCCNIDECEGRVCYTCTKCSCGNSLY